MKNKVFIYAFIALLLTYLGLTIGLPADSETLRKYSMTATKADVLSLTIALPLIVFWFFAFYGFLRFKNYAEVLASAKEGRALKLLAWGLGVLAFSSPTVSIISSLLTYWVSKNTGLQPELTIIRNYLGLAFSLTSIYLLARGAEEFTKSLRPKISIKEPAFFKALIAVLACLFTWLVIEQPKNGTSGSYFLPNWLAIFTIVLPYIYLWYKGFMTVYHLTLYKDKVQGRIYKKAFEYLAKGIGGIVLLSILLQFLRALTAWLTELGLGSLLLFIYVLLIFYAIGFVYVAKGARQLKKIEDV